MIGHVGDRVAHGGPIVAVLGAVDHVLMFFIAVTAGSLVTALLVNVLKKDMAKSPRPVRCCRLPHQMKLQRQKKQRNHLRLTAEKPG